MKSIGELQKFRIPFRNLSEHDLEVEFNFAEASTAVSGPALRRQDSIQLELEEDQNETQSPVEFMI